MSPLFLRPSDIHWVFDKCPRCYWRKAHGYQMPQKAMTAPMAIGNAFDSFAKAKAREDFLVPLGGPSLGRVVLMEWVESSPIDVDGYPVVIRGKLDRIYEAEHDTYSLIDFKAGSTTPEMYRDQLMAYVTALANPKDGQVREVSRMGVLAWDLKSSQFSAEDDVATLKAGMSWTEVDINHADFYKTLRAIVQVAKSPTPPDPGNWCEFCRCVEEARMREVAL